MIEPTWYDVTIRLVRRHESGHRDERAITTRIPADNPVAARDAGLDMAVAVIRHARTGGWRTSAVDPVTVRPLPLEARPA